MCLLKGVVIYRYKSTSVAPLLTPAAVEPQDDGNWFLNISSGKGGTYRPAGDDRR